MRRLLDNDPDYKTPGIHKLQITLDGANISTWTYPVDRMPTGFLQNVRLMLPADAASECSTGVQTMPHLGRARQPYRHSLAWPFSSTQGLPRASWPARGSR